MITRNFFLLFSHTLTKEQEFDASTNLDIDNFIPLPKDLQEIFSNVPPDLDSLDSYLEPIKNWLSQNAKENDYVLVQGDFGAGFTLVNFCRENNLRAVYATTERKSVETMQADGSIKTERVFKHKRFRVYF